MPWNIESGSILVYWPDKIKIKEMIAGFDWVNTLIRSDCGHAIPKSEVDMIWCHTQLPNYLNYLNDNNWTVVIFSNHARTPNINILKAKYKAMTLELSFEPIFIVSLKHDNNEKPNRGMWEYFVSTTKNTNYKIISYVGDGAGKISEDPIYSQHDIDYKFAYNCHMLFSSPDKIFNCEPIFNKHSGLELIITVGQQGSGKTTFSRSVGYTIIDRPNINKLRHTLQKESVIFDATNPTIENRKELINIGKEMGAFITIAWATICGKVYNKGRKGKEKIPSVALGVYSNKFQRPTLNEGVNRIYRIN
jgi:DNA 3'-phosphatase